MVYFSIFLQEHILHPAITSWHALYLFSLIFEFYKKPHTHL